MKETMTTEAFAIKEKLASLEASLLSSSPNMPTILQDIHRTLKSQPHIVTLLSQEDISIVVRGLEAQQGSHIAASITKKSASKVSKAELKNAGFDDLFG